MPAYKVNYWMVEWDYRDMLDPHTGTPSLSVGVNAPTFMQAMALFESVHRYESTQVHSVEYIGPGIKGNTSFFETINPDYSLGYWTKPFPWENPNKEVEDGLVSDKIL